MTVTEYKVVFDREYLELLPVEIQHALSENTELTVIPASILTEASTLGVYAGRTELSPDDLTARIEELLSSVEDTDHGVVLIVVETASKALYYAMPEEGAHFIEVSSDEFRALSFNAFGSGAFGVV